jgi:hypothetical protein
LSKCSISSISSISSSVRAACAHPSPESLGQTARLLLPLARVSKRYLPGGGLPRAGGLPGHPLNASVRRRCRWRRTTPLRSAAKRSGGSIQSGPEPGRHPRPLTYHLSWVYLPTALLLNLNPNRRGVCVTAGTAPPGCFASSMPWPTNRQFGLDRFPCVSDRASGLLVCAGLIYRPPVAHIRSTGGFC